MNRTTSHNTVRKIALSSKWCLAVTWLVRVSIGIVFIVSGFSKGIDPWGTIYKVEDYLNFMGIDIPYSVTLAGVFFLCGSEFLCGVFLLTGCLRKGMPVVAAAFMLFMLPLTLWIAVTNPVADCGCFGDFWILSNWATFFKNVIITAGVVWLLIFSRFYRGIIVPSLQWIAFLATGAFIIAIAMWGYIYQPLIDFRPYKIGEKIVSDDNEESRDLMKFIYQKGDEKREFTEDNLPDDADGWEFVERVEEKASLQNNERNLRIWSEDGNDDVTATLLDTINPKMLLFIPDLGDFSIASSYQINSLDSWSKKHGIEMMAIVSGSYDELHRWKDLSMPSYPIYTAEDTMIKEVVRGNPGVVFVDKGRIVWKSSLRAMNSDDFMQSTADDALYFARNDKRILQVTTLIYLAVVTVLILMSAGFRIRLPKRKPKSDDMALREE